MMKRKAWNKKWNKETASIVALKCKHRTEFARKYAGAYDAARDGGYLESICLHMNPDTPFKEKYVYVYVFKDSSVYVGSTVNLKRRHSEHLNKSLSHSIRNQLENRLSYGPFSLSKALKLEQEQVNLYAKKGFHILNKAKCYSTGSVSTKSLLIQSTTYKDFMRLASEYKCRDDFKLDGNYSLYKLAVKNGWIDDAFSKNYRLEQAAKKHSFENIKKVASAYKYRSEFSASQRHLYGIALKNKWIEILFPQIKKRKLTNGINYN